VHPHRTLVAPADTPTAGPQEFVFAKAPGARGSCVPAAALVVCQPLLAAPGEENRLDRTFAVSTAEDVVLSGTVTPRPGPSLDALIAAHRSGPSVSASSSLVLEPQGNAGAATDGDPRTSWVAGETGAATMTLSWPTPQLISSLDFVVPAGLPVSPPEVVHVQGTGAATGAAAGQDALVSTTGHVELTPLTARSITLSFPRTFLRYSASPGQAPVPLPVGFAEVQVNGAPNVSGRSDAAVRVPCGHGPPVVLDGRTLPTAVTARLGDLVALRPVRLSVCGGPQWLGTGGHRVFSDPQGAFSVAGLSARPTRDWPGAAAGPPVGVTAWGPDQRTVTLPQGSGDSGAYLVVHENFNDGWVATSAGHQLTAVRVDGWQQGWLVPAGVTTVQLDFAPQRAYLVALAVGALCLLALLALAFVPLRRSSRAALAWRRRAGGRQTLGEVALAAVVVVVVGGVWGALAVAAALVVRAVLGRGPALPLLAAAGATLTCWSALPAVTAAGTVPTGPSATLTAAAGLGVLAVVVAAAVPVRRGRATASPLASPEPGAESR